jgi:hypothetical protein
MENITFEGDDEHCWICVCGNTPDQDGFYPCDATGEEMEPLIGSDFVVGQGGPRAWQIEPAAGDR